MSKRIEPLTGKRFGTWTVVEKVNDVGGVYNSLWKCRCDCGTEKTMKGKVLIEGRSKSCGCNRPPNKSATKHGMSNTKVYHAWQSMISRCERTYNYRYEQYSKRGITVCPEWRESFETFYEYVSKLEHYNEKGYSLDRINNDEGYKPGNVRWADSYTQMNNTTRNRHIEIDGITKTLAEWVKLYNMKYRTVENRLRKGWSAYDALTKPVKEVRK